MNGGASPAARALTDGDDRLIRADEPLAGLQMRCGGELPGVIAIPALLEAVRKARRYDMKLARTINVIDDEERVTAFVEVIPGSGEDRGCEVFLRNWRAVPAPAEDEAEIDHRRTTIARHVAEVWALLDREQKLQAVQGEAPDTAAVVSAMHEGLGRYWTDFVDIAGMDHLQPMHWRLLDGAKVSLDGSARDWRAYLVPRYGQLSEPNGFELLLVSEQLPPGSEPKDDVGDRNAPQVGTRLVGREVAPVLRQPISRIIANAESIRTRLAGPLADEYASYAGEIAVAGQHLLALLDDLSDLEVVEAENFRTAADEVDLSGVAAQAAGILSVRAKEREIEIRVPDGAEAITARAEFRRVLQILLNLIGNAIRYSPKGSEIWVRLDDDGETARVTVADQGPGLSEEEAARVFDKFERLGRSGDGGSGLGLYISRRLAQAMDGDLSVQSAPGQGARFVLELPLVTAEPSGAAAQAHPQ